MLQYMLLCYYGHVTYEQSSWWFMHYTYLKLYSTTMHSVVCDTSHMAIIL